MLSLTFGDAAARERTLEEIRAIHRRVHGALPEAAGRFPAGTPYSAEDPDLLLWVHATLLDSIPLVYSSVVAPLTPAEHDAYCEEAATIAVALGARAGDVPRTWRALRAYMDGMLASSDIAVSGQARDLARAVLAPTFAPAIWPIAWVNRLVTVGWLPARLRAEYGFEWSPASERHLARVLRTMAWTRRHVPAPIPLWPEARGGHPERPAAATRPGKES
jgi:uncharacterized protein (DUF2236 family)